MVATELLIRVAELRDARKTAAQVAEELAAKRAAFDAENAVLLSTAKLADEAVRAAETSVRAVAAAEYEKTQEAKLCPGVTVKLFETLHYEPSAALAWAREHQMALIPESLDKKAFEKIAKAANGVGGSYIIVEPRVTIAADLDAALAAVEATSNV